MKKLARKTYLKRASALMNVWDTPQSNGMPTNSQAITTEPVELEVASGEEAEVFESMVKQVGVKG
uniref:hypothetical protein n=1 Tax=Hymenobacter metallilatus TaxID=2493666 RepID=UPI001C8BF2EE|nr:hypothetical protein [Hymenobacter metallilatus]